MTLWTQSILEGARHIYAKHGFRIVEEKDHSLFGVALRGETWMLDLTQAARESGHIASTHPVRTV